MSLQFMSPIAAAEVPITPAQIAEWLAVLVGDHGIVELRALKVPQRYGNPKTEFGFFDRDHLPEMAAAAVDLTNRGASGVYFALNAVNRDLHARALNRARVAERGEATTDSDIIRRQWLLIDADPKRISGVSSTEEEKARAWQVIEMVRAELASRGWPEPIVADSGNGYHLLYRIDLPAADGDLVKRVLQVLSARFSDSAAEIDTAVFNPARICKLYGTVSRKGDDLPDARPHRLSRVLVIPTDLREVSVELLEAVATSAESAPLNQPNRSDGPSEGEGASSESSRPTRSHLQLGNVRERARAYLRNTPPAISGERGHDRTFSTACRLVMGFGLSEDEAFPLIAEWNSTCQPPWTESELRHKLYDAARQTGERGYLLRSRTTDSSQQSSESSNQSADQAHRPFSLDLMSSADFAAADFHQRFLINRVLVEGQPCIIGGPKKALKTATLIDLAISVGSGTPFLGNASFAVAEAANVAILSGESGMYTLQETARRIAMAHGVELSNCLVWWCDRLPQIADPNHLEVLSRAIRHRNIRVCIIDPAYLCLLGGDTRGRQAANMFDIGPLLRSLSDVAGCTLVLAHHTRKNPADKDKYGIPELEDLAYAGFAEFARQWILLNRRAAYVPGTGHHELWLSIGGSAGHSSNWALAVDEGVPDDEFRGRRWCVTVTSVNNAINHIQAERRARQDQERRDRDRLNADHIVSAVRDANEPLTRNEIKDRLGLSGTVFNPAFAEVLSRNVLVPTTKRRGNGQTYPAYLFASGPVGRPSGSSGCPDDPAHTVGQGAMYIAPVPVCVRRDGSSLIGT